MSGSSVQEKKLDSSAQEKKQANFWLNLNIYTIWLKSVSEIFLFFFFADLYNMTSFMVNTPWHWILFPAFGVLEAVSAIFYLFYVLREARNKNITQWSLAIVGLIKAGIIGYIVIEGLSLGFYSFTLGAPLFMVCVALSWTQMVILNQVFFSDYLRLAQGCQKGWAAQVLAQEAWQNYRHYMRILEVVTIVGLAVATMFETLTIFIIFTGLATVVFAAQAWRAQRAKHDFVETLQVQERLHSVVVINSVFAMLCGVSFASAALGLVSLVMLHHIACLLTVAAVVMILGYGIYSVVSPSKQMPIVVYDTAASPIDNKKLPQQYQRLLSVLNNKAAQLEGAGQRAKATAIQSIISELKPEVATDNTNEDSKKNEASVDANGERWWTIDLNAGAQDEMQLNINKTQLQTAITKARTTAGVGQSFWRCGRGATDEYLQLAQGFCDRLPSLTS